MSLYPFIFRFYLSSSLPIPQKIELGPFSYLQITKNFQTSYKKRFCQNNQANSDQVRLTRHDFLAGSFRVVLSNSSVGLPSFLVRVVPRRARTSDHRVPDPAVQAISCLGPLLRVSLRQPVPVGLLPSQPGCNVFSSSLSYY